MSGTSVGRWRWCPNSVVFLATVCVLAYSVGAQEPPEGEEKGTLSVDVEPTSAEVFVDGALVARGDVELDNWDPGWYYLEVRERGYEAYAQWVHITGGRDLVVRVELRRLVGTLHFTSDPPDAHVEVQGKRYAPGSISLPEGRYRAVVRRFGYTDQVHEITVADRQVVVLSVELASAPFALRGVRVPRSTLSPGDPGVMGGIPLTFEVSGPGMARVTVFAADDHAGREPLRTYAFPRLEGWFNRVVWDGRATPGGLVGDGAYRIVVEAAAHDPRAPIYRRERWVTVDRTVTARYRSLWSGEAGLLYAPFAEVLPPTARQVASEVVADTDEGEWAVPLLLSLRFGLPHRFEISTAVAPIVASEASLRAITARIALRWGVPTDSRRYRATVALRGGGVAEPRYRGGACGGGDRCSPGWGCFVCPNPPRGRVFPLAYPDGAPFRREVGSVACHRSHRLHQPCRGYRLRYRVDRDRCIDHRDLAFYRWCAVGSACRIRHRGDATPSGRAVRRGCCWNRTRIRGAIYPRGRGAPNGPVVGRDVEERIAKRGNRRT